MPQPKNALGPVIKETRLAAGWTLEQLASQLTDQGWPCNVQLVSRIEAQEQEIKDFELLFLSAALGVPAQELWDRMMKARSQSPAV